MRSVFAAFTLALLASIPRTVSAQVPEDSSHLVRGVVGLEAAYGQTPGIAGFFFSSATTSWVLGIDRVTMESVVNSRPVRQTSLGFRFGVRRWPREMTGPFKLFVGAGASSADVDPNQTGVGDEFGYGELGAVLFLGSRLSLNAAGELSVAYGNDEARNGRPTTTDVLPSRFFVRGTRFRIGASVYLFPGDGGHADPPSRSARLHRPGAEPR